MDKLQSFGKNISLSFTPFASRSQQYIKEQLGQADDKVSNPSNPAPASVTAETAAATFSSSPASSSLNAALNNTSIPNTPSSGSGLVTFSGLFMDSKVLFALRRRLTENKTQLPSEYTELEKRVDALKQVHQKMLAVTYVPQPLE